jgi:hypothetical protein
MQDLTRKTGELRVAVRSAGQAFVANSPAWTIVSWIDQQYHSQPMQTSTQNKEMVHDWTDQVIPGNVQWMQDLRGEAAD